MPPAGCLSESPTTLPSENLYRAANRGLLDRRAEAGYPASSTTGPLRSERVVVNRTEPAPVFIGGDPRLHYDPLLVHEAPDEILRRPRTTGPPE